MLPLLATSSDASLYGYTVTDAALRRASARVRGFLRQQVSTGTSTVVGMGPSVTLPERPVVSVTSVKNSAGIDVPYDLEGSDVSTHLFDYMTITYSHGLATLPDEMVEVICGIASRIAAAPASIEQGVQSEGIGPSSITYGMDAWRAQGGLTTGEKDVLRRYWPKIPRTLSMGSPAGLGRSSLSRFDLDD